MTTITRIYNSVKSGLSLEVALENEGLTGVDMGYWRQLIANYDPNRKPRKQTKRNSGRVSKKSGYARMQSAIGLAMLELVERVNNDDPSKTTLDS